MTSKFLPTLKPQRQTSSPKHHDSTHQERKLFDLEETITHRRPSLDLTQRLERRLAEYNASTNVFKRWLLEVVSWTISALCMIAIIGIYLHVNGHNMVNSEWPLNLANILGKVSSAALIVPTSEALGQLKWNWFHDSKAMWDFEIFDKASRGPWGAALLLYRTKGRSLAALGALLIVLILAIDTFFQQVVDYPDKWAPELEQSEIPRVVQYTPFYTPEYYLDYELNYIDQNVKPVLSKFFLDNGTQPVPFGNGTRADIPLSCPASSCTWPVYETIGVCSECADVSNLLDFACLSTKIDWSTTQRGPNVESSYPQKTACGYYLNATSSAPVLMVGQVVSDRNISEAGEILLARSLPLTEILTKNRLYGGSIHFKQISAPILDTIIVSALRSENGYQEMIPVAQECMLTWCIKTIRSSYDSGEYTEEVLSTFKNTTSGPDPWQSYSFKEEDENLTMTIYGPDIGLTPPPAYRDQHSPTVYNNTYWLSNQTASNVIAVFDDYFPSSYTTIPSTALPMMRYKNFHDGPSLRKVHFNPLLAPNNITYHFEKLASALTNAIRSDADCNAMVRGEAMNKKKFVSIHWEWLIFPFALLLLGLAFLVSTIIKTSKDTATGVWKTSAMPTLIYGLPEEVRARLNASPNWESSYGDTKKVRIRLLPNLGWRVSRQSMLKSPLLPVRKNQPPPGWI
jgi:hypothetical protein